MVREIKRGRGGGEIEIERERERERDKFLRIKELFAIEWFCK